MPGHLGVILPAMGLMAYVTISSWVPWTSHGN